MIEFWAIKHLPTGKYLPEPKGRLGRGGSHVEPEFVHIKRPRLLPTKRGAQNVLSAWLRGKHHAERYYESDGEYGPSYWVDDIPSVEPVPERIKADMAVVKFVAKEEQ